MAATLLELKDVQKDYHIRKYGRVIRTYNALNKLSFKVKKGQIFGFLGPNGAGKTTTIKCITGILKYDKGTISIDGKNIEENDFENKNRIGLSFGHISNAQLGKKNPGLEVLSLTYQIPF